MTEYRKLLSTPTNERKRWKNEVLFPFCSRNSPIAYIVAAATAAFIFFNDKKRQFDQLWAKGPHTGRHLRPPGTCEKYVFGLMGCN
uniref:Transmembrane protein n=1 Tax=Acrobeloides nanus TaxID=290746 RepID=A0A914DKP1_9BILA